MDVPPLPPKPDLEPKPTGSWLSIALVGLVGFGLATVLTFLTLGWFGPIVLLGLGVFFIIGLQYLLWGWLFERIYRTPAAIEQAKAEEAAPQAKPETESSRDQTWSR